MRAVVQRILVVLIAVAIFTLRAGVGETVENVLHLVAHGHTAHDTDHASADHATANHGDAHSDLEHGCAEHFHVCPCCAHPVMAHPALGLSVPLAPASAEQLTLAFTRAGPEGTNAVVFRPPIAG